MWKLRLLGGLAAALCVCLGILMFLPANWLAWVVERQTQGRLSIGDAQGSFWQGSGFIGVAASSQGALTPLFPGRFSWTISPQLLLGKVNLRIENAAALDQALTIRGDRHALQVSAASLLLPSERLEGLGAPLNTVGPTGNLRLSWQDLQVQLAGPQASLYGSMQLDMQQISARLTKIKPLGDYQMKFVWQGQQAQLQLLTLRGALQLQGQGELQQGRLKFSGRAWADRGYEEKLANLLNLLGQRRKEGDRDVIALEFK